MSVLWHHTKQAHHQLVARQGNYSFSKTLLFRNEDAKRHLSSRLPSCNQGIKGVLQLDLLVLNTRNVIFIKYLQKKINLGGFFKNNSTVRIVGLSDYISVWEYIGALNTSVEFKSYLRAQISLFRVHHWKFVSPSPVLSRLFLMEKRKRKICPGAWWKISVAYDLHNERR